MTKQTCTISGEEFEVSELEIKLREKFGFFDLPTTAPWVRFRELGAFWQHWNLHNRKCDKTGKPIISVFSEKCPYPVWHKDVWMKENNPPSADYDFSTAERGAARDFFSQAWELFQKCPIPHNTGVGNENCEYTDDWWYSKNCYLCHSGVEDEDLKYCYRLLNSNDSDFCVFGFNHELALDCVNSRKIFDSKYLLSCQNVQDSAFLYDCRNCSNCMFCFNLRNKQYCFGNKQLSREEYEKKKAQWNLKSREIYDKAKSFFAQMMTKNAWHRTLYLDKCENTTGNYTDNCNDCVDCYFVNGTEESANLIRNYTGKTLLDMHGQTSELVFRGMLIQDKCYMTRFGVQLVQCRFVDYSMYCFQCENCFGCCGLVGKKYCIFNKQYTKEEYEKTREKIIAQMKKEGTWGKFFPGYFAPNPYDESWAGYHFPLTREAQEKLGFRVSEISERKNKNYLPTSEIPDSVDDLTPEKEAWLTKQIFWDEEYHRPFKILPADIKFSRDLGCPLPNTYYMRRIKENFAWMPFNGKLRDTKCGKCAKKIQTSWPEKYNGRILCEECYLDVLN